MTTTQIDLRNQLATIGRSLFNRGLTAGTSGNMSVRLDDGWLMTPTNCCLGSLDPEDISLLDLEGRLLSGHPPSKEFFLHRAFLDQRPADRAVIHLHCTAAVAVSCLEGLDPANALPPITPYAVMRFGRVALIPYHRPGAAQLGEAISDCAGDYSAVLLANHGPIVAGPSLEQALYAIEELEETAKVFLLLHDKNYRQLTNDQVAELRRHKSFTTTP